MADERMYRRTDKQVETLIAMQMDRQGDRQADKEVDR
jgi:hypothetical protein